MGKNKWRVENRIPGLSKHSMLKPWAVVHPSGVVITYHKTWAGAWKYLNVYLNPEVTVDVRQSWADLSCVIEIKGDPSLWEDLSNEEY